MIDCDVTLGKRLKILEASKWETTGGGMEPGRIRARGVRRHERKGQEEGVLKGWEE